MSESVTLESLTSEPRGDALYLGQVAFQALPVASSRRALTLSSAPITRHGRANQREMLLGCGDLGPGRGRHIAQSGTICLVDGQLATVERTAGVTPIAAVS